MQYSVDEIVLPRRSDAEKVLHSLRDVLIYRTAVTVSDLYSLVDFQHNYLDATHGWNDLSAVPITKVSTGYRLDLPEVLRVV